MHIHPHLHSQINNPKVAVDPAQSECEEPSDGSIMNILGNWLLASTATAACLYAFSIKPALRWALDAERRVNAAEEEIGKLEAALRSDIRLINGIAKDNCDLAARLEALTRGNAPRN